MLWAAQHPRCSIREPARRRRLRQALATTGLQRWARQRTSLIAPIAGQPLAPMSWRTAPAVHARNVCLVPGTEGASAAKPIRPVAPASKSYRRVAKAASAARLRRIDQHTRCRVSVVFLPRGADLASRRAAKAGARRSSRWRGRRRSVLQAHRSDQRIPASVDDAPAAATARRGLSRRRRHNLVTRGAPLCPEGLAPPSRRRACSFYLDRATEGRAGVEDGDRRTPLDRRPRRSVPRRAWRRSGTASRRRIFSGDSAPNEELVARVSDAQGRATSSPDVQRVAGTHHGRRDASTNGGAVFWR
jgi:hypothetical protein